MEAALEMPSVRTYGKYSSDNYGAHSLEVSVGPIDLYYSYRTLVAFRAPGFGLVVISNYWGPTTGKHLNWIDGGERDRLKMRLSQEQFETKWVEVQVKYFGRQ